jgi:hypothetical protein
VRLRSILVVAALAGAALLPGQGLLGSAPAGAAAVTRVIPCTGVGGPEFKPKTFQLACADANSYVADIKWTSWKLNGARGLGTLKENDCVPNCVSGKFSSSPTSIVLSQPVASHYGKLFSVVVVGSITVHMRG